MPDLRSLSAQMVLSAIALVLLMAAAAGLPAVWLIRQQLDRQAWAQVQQGSLAAQALYAARQSELAGLAILTAQRPTLKDLLEQGDWDALSAYLRTLQQGSGLDLVYICEAAHESGASQGVAQSGDAVSDNLCAEMDDSGFHVLSQEATAAGALAHVWLLANYPLPSGPDGSGRMVIVGMALDDGFAIQMRDQTGLEHTLLVRGQPVSTTLAARRSLPLAFLEEPESRFDLNGHPYYVARFPLGGMELDAEVALDVSAMVMTQRQLVWALAGSILAVTAVALLLGTVLARRVGRPLAHLAQAADSMSKGDLEGPLAVESHVREVVLLAQALDGARSDLKRSLAELRRQKAWSDHLLEAIVEGIVTMDRQGHITFFSHGAERISGWQRDQAVGRTCDRVFKPLDSHEPFSQLIPSPGRRRKISVELPDGRHATLAVTGAQLSPPEGGDARVALVFRDISEEEAVHRLLGHFLANVAHEFRTPLSSLAASVELLLDQAPDLDADELQELLTSLHLGVLGLQTLIDNLLESASIEAGHFRVQPRPSPLGNIIADAIAMMQPLLDKRGQELVVELPLQSSAMPVVQADPRRTVQVLVNLLSNASKYGPDDAEIEVSAALQDEWIRISVADSGPGVPAEYRQDLFRRFVHPGLGNDRAQVGVGLGLSVVKAVVEAHGGQVGVEDHPGGGLVFWFTLPVAGDQQPVVRPQG